MSRTTTTSASVLLFLPNVVGYARVISALTSFVLMIAVPSRWLLAVFLYLSNFIGDLFDGLLARKLDQCSTFGSVLDMVTDRCGTLGLFFVLSVEYLPVDERLVFPFFRLGFLALCLLDVASHWVQTYSTLLIGQHHKSQVGNADRNFLVRWFYQYYWFFGYLCVGAEFTYVLLYVKRHLDDTSCPYVLRLGIDLFLAMCIPGCLAKQIVNTAQLLSACSAIASHDAAEINKKKGN
jgi:CDP-diacylglycerol--inositol 3-phosphatidyltransferase